MNDSFTLKYGLFNDYDLSLFHCVDEESFFKSIDSWSEKFCIYKLNSLFEPCILDDVPVGGFLNYFILNTDSMTLLPIGSIYKEAILCQEE